MAAYRFACQLSSDALRDAANIVISPAGTILGFTVTAMSILLTIGNTTLLENLRKNGQLKQLLTDLFIAATFFGMCLMLELPAGFVPQEIAAGLLAAGVGAFVGASIRMIQAGHRFYLVITHI